MPRRTGRLAEDHFRSWLAARLSGCSFAAGFGGELERTSFYEPVTALDADEVETVLDECAAREQVAVLLFPDVREIEEVAEIVRILAAHRRWDALIDPAMARDPSEVGIRLAWKTREERISNAMGFAPFARMPVSRRAPYVALAAWTGGHSNTIRKQRLEHMVTMGDAPPHMNEANYKSTLRKTKENTLALMDGEVNIDVVRNLAFRFSKTVVDARLPALATVPDVG